MIKIVYTVSTLQKTGPTNVLAGIIAHLDRKLYKPFVITLSPEKNSDNSWGPDLKKQGVRVISLNLKRYQLIQLPIKLKQTITSIHPAIIHSHCFRSTVLSALFLDGFKRVATVHCDYTQDFPMAYGRVTGRLMACCFTYALKKMNKRICCSQALSDLLQKKFPTISFDYVNNGVDTDTFYPVSEKKRIRQQLGLPPNKTIFIWAGAFIPRKDPLCLASAIMKIDREKAFFVFCGEGPLLKNTKERLKGFNNILFVGYTNQIAPYLQASDAYISTSLSEGFHLSVYEALACGLPVILSDLDIYDKIKKTGCSFVFSPANPKGLQTKILVFLAHSGTEFSDRAVTFIKQDFSTEKMSLKYQEYYKE